MTTAAKADYLTALIGESQQREQRYQASLAAATTPHDTQAATTRLSDEQAHQKALRTELGALPTADALAAA